MPTLYVQLQKICGFQGFRNCLAWITSHSKPPWNWKLKVSKSLSPWKTVSLCWWSIYRNSFVKCRKNPVWMSGLIQYGVAVTVPQSESEYVTFDWKCKVNFSFSLLALCNLNKKFNVLVWICQFGLVEGSCFWITWRADGYPNDLTSICISTQSNIKLH